MHISLILLENSIFMPNTIALEIRINVDSGSIIFRPFIRDASELLKIINSKVTVAIFSNPKIKLDRLNFRVFLKIKRNEFMNCQLNFFLFRQ